MSEETYVSTDVETDGPIPGPHSVLSFGSAANAADGQLLGTFEANLRTLPGAYGHPETMAWWKTQPEAWAACMENAREPADVMREYVAWVMVDAVRRVKEIAGGAVLRWAVMARAVALRKGGVELRQPPAAA